MSTLQTLLKHLKITELFEELSKRTQGTDLAPSVLTLNARYKQYQLYKIGGFAKQEVLNELLSHSSQLIVAVENREKEGTLNNVLDKPKIDIIEDPIKKIDTDFLESRIEQKKQHLTLVNDQLVAVNNALAGETNPQTAVKLDHNLQTLEEKYQKLREEIVALYQKLKNL